MSIRTKLVGGFLAVALLVALLGGIAISRVNSINDDVATLTEAAIPTTMRVQELDQIQRQQQIAVLAYQASGRPEDRQQFTDLAQRFDAGLAELKSSVASSGDRAAAGRVKVVEDQRTAFDAAASQVFGTRARVDRNLGEMRTKNAEIVRELASVRARYIPSGAGGANTDAASVPVQVRNQINDLLLGTEGMLRVVGEELALASGITITPSPEARQQFEGAGAIFNNWLQLAYFAGGPDDRAILTRVQDKFYKEFEPSARSMIVAAEFSTRARGVFSESSDNVSGALDAMVAAEDERMASARANASSTASSTTRVMQVLTLIAVVVAGVFGVVVGNSIIRPITRLRDAVNRISRGELENVEIDVTSKDEVGDLANAFRRMVASVRFLMMGGDDDEEPGEMARAS